uniref:Uncharacterized protein n=1 Tax=Panagrolaimus davidi TaxID=227884 RepID=A0A914PWG0_9BILA
MSSTDMQHGSESSKHSLHRLSCNFCVVGSNQENEQQRLDELITDFERLKTEKTDLLRQNITCKTDIKKLKGRQSYLAGELDKANDEIQRLKKMLKRLSLISSSSKDSTSLPPTPTNITNVPTATTPPASKTSITITPITMANSSFLPDRPFVSDEDYINLPPNRVTVGQ